MVGFSIGVVGCFAYYMVRAFPANMRYSGVSFAFNVAYAITGALTSFLMPILASFFSKYAAGSYVIVVYLLGVALGWYFLITNTQEKLENDI